MNRILKANIIKCQWIRPNALNHYMNKVDCSLYRKAFHTSQQRNIHPMIVLLLKPVGKIGAIISGRFARKSWQSMSPEGKARVRRKLWEMRYKFFALGGLLFASGVYNFVSHIQETPVTKRKRFLAFTSEQFLKIAQYEYEMHLETHKDELVPPNHPVYAHIVSTAQKIVNSNQDEEFFRKQKWTVIVVDSDEENAFVLPTGHIFVFTGLLKVTGTDDQLAMVLGHEMAHAFLSHGAEQVSFAAVLDWFIILVMAAIWAFIPSDGIALITQWFYKKVMHILLSLPYSRKLEEEADQVGLTLAAKACFDVRHSSAFWDLMDIRENLEPDLQIPQYLSTHPNNKSRADMLNEAIPKAIDLRKYCDCPNLPKLDPRLEVTKLRAELEEAKRIQEQQKTEQTVINPGQQIVPISREQQG